MNRPSSSLRFPKGTSAIRRALVLLLRLATTAGLLWVLATRMDLARAERILSHLSLPPLALALAALLIGMVPINALRWRVILTAEGHSPGLRSLMKLSFI